MPAQYMLLERILLNTVRGSCGGYWKFLTEYANFVSWPVILHEKLVATSDMFIEIP